MKRLQDDVVTQLGEVMPWLEENLHTIHSPALTMDPRTQQLQLDPRGIIPLTGQPLPQTLGAGILPTETAYRNILIAGDGPFDLVFVPGFVPDTLG